jgi:hypothetical protein
MSETAPSGARATRRLLGLLEWPERVTPAERRSLWAGGLGWMLDAMDVMLYSMVLAHMMRELGMDKASGGLLNSLTLIASAIGGLLFGFLATASAHAGADARSSSTRFRAAPVPSPPRSSASRLPLRARPRDGRRVDDRRRADRGALAAEHRAKALDLMLSRQASAR